MRGLAILLVLVCHYLSGELHGNLSPWLRRIVSASNIGWSGVDLFFVLSGFLIGGILLDERNSPNYFRAFYMRRVHRILPIYYGWTLVYLIVMSAGIWGSLGGSPVERRELLAVPIQLLFLQNLQFAWTPWQTMWFAVTWSLAVEEQFYLFVPLLVRWLAERRLMAGLIGVVCVAPVIRVLVFHCLEPDAARVLLPCRADALAIGALLAAGWRKDWFQEYVKEHARLLQGGVVLLAAGVAAMLPALIGGTNLVQATIGYSWMALLHGGMLLLVLSRPGNWLGAAMRWKWLRSLGTVSYCVYLIHLAFLIFAHYLIRGRSPRLESWGDAGVSALALGATLGVATISWRWLEKPLIRRGHSYSYREGS